MDSTFLQSSLSGVVPSSTYDRHGTYFGSTLEGQRHGSGKYQFANAFYQYQGDWVDGMMHGEGTLRMADGGMYQGSFDRGAMNGQGMRKWASGATYSGDFVAGEMSGQGTYISATGEHYQGQFVGNQRHGVGHLKTSTGDYEGQFAAHKMSGQGNMLYLDVGRYEGQWVESKRSGSGSMTWEGSESVDVYEGEWADDKAHGKGRFASQGASDGAAGYERAGTWIEGDPEYVATTLALSKWVPPAGPLVLRELCVRRPVAAASVVEAAQGEAESAVTEEVGLALSLTVIDADGEVEGYTTTVSLVSVEAPSTLPAAVLEDHLEAAVDEALAYMTYQVAPGVEVSLSLPEGVPRPLRLEVSLRASEAVVATAEIVLEENGGEAAAAGTGAVLVGHLSDTPLSEVPSDAYGGETPPAPAAMLSLSYYAADEPPPLEPAEALTEISTQESLEKLLNEEMGAGSRIPALTGICLRAIEREPTEEEVAAHEAAFAEAQAAAAKGKKKGKVEEAEAVPEPLGPMREFYPVVNENGRQIDVTLRLPEDVAVSMLEAAAAVAQEAANNFEAAQASKAEAAAAASAAAEEAGATTYVLGEENFDVGVMPPVEQTPEAPPPPRVKWHLGSFPSVAGRLLLRGMIVPDDVPTGQASMELRETTKQPAIFELQPFETVHLPVNLVAMPNPDEPEPPPPPAKKGK